MHSSVSAGLRSVTVGCEVYIYQTFYRNGGTDLSLLTLFPNSVPAFHS